MKKLVLPAIQSQRDNRWYSVILGNNTLSQYNIGMYGCLITSFGNYLGKTPIEINNIKSLFDTGNGNLIWSKTPLIGLNNVYTSPRYEDAVTSQGINKMKSLIDEGRPLICEIDFNPNTVQEDQHYVLVIGYDETKEDTFIAVDPWTGTVIDLSVYGGVKRTLYTFRAYDKILPFDTGADYFLGIDLNNKESVKICVQTWKDVVDGKYIKVEDCQKKVTDTETKFNNIIKTKDETIDNLNQQIKDLKNDKIILSDELKDCQKEVEANADCPNKLLNQTQIANQVTQDFETAKGNWSTKEINYQKQINTLKTRLDAFKSPTKKLLVDIWAKITGQS